MAVACGRSCLWPGDVRGRNHGQPVCVLLLCRLWADAQMAELLTRYRMAYRLSAPACGLHYQPVPGISSVGLGPLRLWAGIGGFRYSGCPSLWFKTVWPKNSQVWRLSLHQTPAVSEPWAFRFWPLHHVAAHGDLSATCGNAVCLLLPSARGGATHAGD